MHSRMNDYITRAHNATTLIQISRIVSDAVWDDDITEDEMRHIYDICSCLKAKKGIYGSLI